MKDRYLEVTFRKGKPLAAYLYLPRKPGTKSVRSEKAGGGIVVDFDEAGEAIGLEITAPGACTVDEINDVLERLGHARIGSEELAPVAA
jgi:uncharacterized protein YuzE